jgi:hypothetical protein
MEILNKKYLLSLCLTLFFGLIPTLQAEDDTENECTEGMYFNASLGRCVMNTSTTETKTNAQNCEGLEGDEFKKCFQDNVDNEVTDLEDKGKIDKASDPKQKIFIPAVVTLGSAYYLFMNKEALESCGSTSVWLMLGGGVSSLLGEVLAQNKYKKKLKSMNSTFQERLKEKSIKEEENIEIVSTNQVAAFDYQIEQEEARAKAHKSRKSTYNLAFGLYTAATVAAIYEGFTNGWTVSQCSGSTSYNMNFTPIRNSNRLVVLTASPKIFGKYYYLEDFSPRDILEIVYRETLGGLVVSNVYAEEKASTSDILTALTGKKAATKVTTDVTKDVLTEKAKTSSEFLKGMDEIAGSPAFRAALSGVLAGYSKSVAKKAGKLHKQAQDRAEAIKKIKEDFVANGGAGFGQCTIAERKLPSKPSCYCYIADGSRDPSKAESPTCMAAFGAIGIGEISASDYDMIYGGGDYGAQGCISKPTDGVEACDCKTMACGGLSGELKLGDLGSMTGVPSMIKTTKAFTDGNLKTDNLKSTDTNKAAARLNRRIDNLRKKPDTKKEMAKIDKLGLKMKKSFGNSIRKAAASGGLGSSMAGAGFGSSPPVKSAADVVRNAKANLQKSFKSNSVSRRSGGSRKKSSMGDFDFGGGKGGIQIDDNGIEDIMAKNFNINDISDNTEANIFAIINNRYQSSGIKRLFAKEREEGKDK